MAKTVQRASVRHTLLSILKSKNEGEKTYRAVVINITDQIYVMIEEIGLEGNLVFEDEGENENENDSKIDDDKSRKKRDKLDKKKDKKKSIDFESKDGNANKDKVNLKFGQEIIVKVDFYEDIGEVDTKII